MAESPLTSAGIFCTADATTYVKNCRCVLEKRVILVVDDEEYVAKLAKAILMRSGFDVTIAQSGRAGLEAVQAKAGRVALALLDVRMPDIDGLSLLPLLREADPNMKVILTSGYIGENVLSQFGDEVGFLQKRFNVAGLTAAVETALSVA
jgi:two-component system cell cycle sensor histidine kinase/response regulator CckA